MANTPGRSASPYSAGTHGSDYDDPFSDRPRQTHFAEQEPPYHASPHLMPRPFESTASLPSAEFGGRGGYDEEDLEKEPLNAGGSFTGGFYPPKCVFVAIATFNSLTLPRQCGPRLVRRPVRAAHLHCVQQRRRQRMAASPDHQARCHPQSQTDKRQLHRGVSCANTHPQRYRGQIRVHQHHRVLVRYTLCPSLVQ